MRCRCSHSNISLSRRYKSIWENFRDCSGARACRSMVVDRDPFVARRAVVASRNPENYDPWRIEDEAASRRTPGLLGSLLCGIFPAYLKARVSYRGDFLISVATSLAASLFALGFVLILITRIPSLGGWSIPEMIFLLWFFRRFRTGSSIYSA